MATPLDPSNVQDFDQPLNTTPTYTVTHTFSTDDIVGTFEGLTQGDVAPGDTPVIDFTADPKVTKDGVELFPINSEFGFNVTDFDGAVQKDFDLNPEYTEGWAGDLTDATGAQIGLVVSDAPTDTFKTPALLGTWLAGLGGNTVKASTEHYAVMQNVLSDQRYPDDPEAAYPLDDNLRIVGGEYDGQYVADILDEIDDMNGDGVVDIKDVLQPNESTISENIAVSDDYSVTMKDDGKLLYRWGNTVKRPNDVRIEAELELPEEWKEPDPLSDNPDLNPLFMVSQAELVIHHTITNNPNDQVRPEDYENESAIGTLPTYEILPDGKWVSTDGYYAGDGTFYPAGTVLKDPAIAAAVAGSTLDEIGALSEDLKEGFTNAWYTTMNREPFEPELNDDGTEYETGPRWRLQPDKYGQDLPSVVIPEDPSLTANPTKDQVKYEVGAETQTVLNLLDWENPVSPLAISAGWLNGDGLTTVNGVTLSDNFDLSIYIKGDVKPATIYSAELVMDYEEIAIFNANIAINGTSGDDFLVGQGGNTFYGGAGSDMFGLSYGTPDSESILSNTITDFEAGIDVIALIDLEINSYTFDSALSQTLVGSTLTISLNGYEIAILTGQTELLDEESFLVLNPHSGGIPVDSIIGTENDDILTGDSSANTIFGLGGNDYISGLEGDDFLYGGDGEDFLDGGIQSDTLSGGAGDDTILGGFGNDTIDGGAGVDTVDYSGFGGNVTVSLINDGNPQTSGGGGVDVITNVENIIGGDYADTLTGGVGDTIIHGGAGSDYIFGLGGGDMLFGEGDNDFIQGGNEDDLLDGGADQDRLDGGDGNDTILGGDDNSLDRLTGAAGDDTLDGGGGRDILRGDTFDSGTSMNITGGADIFDFNEVNDSVAGGLRDIIRDFVQGEDLMDLSDIDAVIGGVDDAFMFIGTAGFSNTAGEVRYQFGGTHTIVSADIDGDSIADFQIDLNGNFDLLVSDFIL